jgi:hypothetical protein
VSHSPPRRRASLATSPPAAPRTGPRIDEAYLRFYRQTDPHDASLQRAATTWRVHHFAPPTPSKGISPHKRSRLELERSWAGGADETPEFDQVRTTKVGRADPRVTSQPAKLAITQDGRKTALLCPGSGSQYNGMGATLLERFESARRVWDEAEEALAGFEKWRKDLKLDEIPELQDLKLNEWPSWVNERDPRELRKLVFGGQRNVGDVFFGVLPKTDSVQDLLMRSSNAQPAICITSLAFLRCLEVRNVYLALRCS